MRVYRVKSREAFGDLTKHSFSGKAEVEARARWVEKSAQTVVSDDEQGRWMAERTLGKDRVRQACAEAYSKTESQ